MKKLLYVLVFLSVLLSACGLEPAATPTRTPTKTPTSLKRLHRTPPIHPFFSYSYSHAALSSGSYGPSNFPADVDPLTGQKVTNPALLQRRPMVIKVQNLPRTGRPQWGLSLADIVFEYYTEEGTTRFAAVFYGNDASMVGPSVPAVSLMPISCAAIKPCLRLALRMSPR